MGYPARNSISWKPGSDSIVCAFVSGLILLQDKSLSLVHTSYSPIVSKAKVGFHLSPKALVRSRVFPIILVPELEDNDSANLLATNFKDTFSRDAKVHFVGVWCVLDP